MERANTKRRRRSSQNDIVLTIFGATERCSDNAKRKTQPVLAGCQSVKRLIYGLRYYTILTQKRRDKDAMATFTDFTQSVWRHYLNDVTHLREHESDLEQIHRSLFTEYGLKRCDLKKCKLSARHCQIDRKEGNDGVGELSNFLADCFDALHYYLFHLYDVGLRTSRAETEMQDCDAQQNLDATKYIDRQFWRRKRRLQVIRKHHPQFFAPFDCDANKFTIYGKNRFRIKKGITYSEQFVVSAQSDDTTNTKGMIQYLVDHAFDSDAIRGDIDRYPNAQSSNLLNLIGDTKMKKKMTYFVNLRRLKSKGFCSGYTWMYWKAFAPKGDSDTDPDTGAVQWHGYTKSEMYSPSPKYGNFKWEMLQYPTMTMKIWKKVSVKVDEYLKNSDEVKALRAWFGTYYNEWAKQYGFAEDAPIDADHLYAVILYCDYQKVCALFRESFTQSDPTEELLAVKKRNKAFWWLSKRLRELVEVFGEDNFNSNHSQRSNICGPFHCNVAFVATVPSFSAVFRGPTSATKQLDVSLAFSKADGMIITLENEHYPGEEQRWFNTSWISLFGEEDERLTIGGQWPLQIVSIRIMRSNQNFESLLHPLYWFDHIISGAVTNNLRGKWKENAVEFILKLMDFAECNNPQRTQIPSYILDVFDHWRFSKKKIKIKTKVFEQLWYQGPPKVLRLFVHSLRKRKYPDTAEPKVNLLTPRILNLFPELEFINILDDKLYPFSLTLFIRMLGTIDAVQRGAFQCVIKGKWVPSEYQKLVMDSNVFQVVLDGKALHILKK